jgi:phosphatidylglycerol---prolipoprotein diacylglyceryl transferase
VSFPVLIPIGSWRVHPHVFFEVLAYAVAAGVFLWIRRRRGDALSSADRLSLVTAIFVGALIGSRLLAWFDSPGAQSRGLVGLMDGKTLVGGLVGGWIATELEKRRRGVQQPTGDLYVFPVIAGIAIGRIGCLLSGLPDGTYGTATMLPWGIDFGDGIARHPTALYESLFAIALGVLLIPVWRRGPAGYTFKLFTVSYLAFRLLVDTIKPGVALFLGLTAIQWVCVFGLMYYAQWFVRRQPSRVARRGPKKPDTPTGA